MRSFRQLLLAAAICASLPAPVSAQFSPKGAPGDIAAQETLGFKAGSGVGGFGTQVGPYTAQVTSYPGSPLVTVYCVDYLHSISVGQSWTANVSQLTLDGMATTRLGIAGDDGNALARYKKAIWLAAQFANNQDATSWMQIHSAIWTIVLGGNDPTQPYYGQYASWIFRAGLAEAGGYYGFNFDDWRVVTDVRADDAGLVDASLQPGAQEYVMYVTPEPETVIMMLSGLLVLALVWRRGGFA